jgi:hypothetical protein
MELLLFILKISRDIDLAEINSIALLINEFTMHRPASSFASISKSNNSAQSHFSSISFGTSCV